MEATFHAWAAEDYAAHLAATEAGRSSLDDFRQVLAQPELQEYTEAIGQPADGWTPGQVASLGRVHLLASERSLGVLRIPVGRAPSPGDRAADRVALAILGTLFTTLVYDAPADDGDGLFSWDERIADQLPGGWTNSAPLAIGPVDASRTLLHLTDRGTVARWPQGSPDVWLFGFPSFTSWFEWREESFASVLGDSGTDQP